MKRYFTQVLVVAMVLLVTVDIFSGRPNPQWQMSEAQSAEFAGRVRKLAPAPGGRMPDAPDLGYRGMEVRDAAAGLPPIRVYGSFARVGDTVYRDDRRELETWLLRNADATVPEELRTEIARQIRGR